MSFCPGPGKKVPENYDVYAYDNDFPALKLDPDEPNVTGTELYKVEKNYGKCEVILYSPDHNTTLPQLSIEHIYKLVNLWVDRFNELSKDKRLNTFSIWKQKEKIG